MAELGKIDREFFDSYVYPNLGADREDVRLDPFWGAFEAYMGKLEAAAGE